MRGRGCWGRCAAAVMWAILTMQCRGEDDFVRTMSFGDSILYWGRGNGWAWR